MGTTENALRIQIWTALIALLLIKWMKHQSRSSWCLSLMGAALRWNLFVYRDLRDWLTDPTAWNVDPPPIIQLCLSITVMFMTISIYAVCSAGVSIR